MQFLRRRCRSVRCARIRHGVARPRLPWRSASRPHA